MLSAAVFLFKYWLAGLRNIKYNDSIINVKCVNVVILFWNCVTVFFSNRFNFVKAFITNLKQLTYKLTFRLKRKGCDSL